MRNLHIQTGWDVSHSSNQSSGWKSRSNWLDQRCPHGLIIFINQCVDEIGQGSQLISRQVVNHPMQLFSRQSHVHHLWPHFITALCPRLRPTRTLDEFSAYNRPSCILRLPGKLVDLRLFGKDFTYGHHRQFTRQRSAVHLTALPRLQEQSGWSRDFGMG